jgi:hypothetical protein
LKTDYDKKFGGWYQEAVCEQFPKSLQAFRKANSSKYFECTAQTMEPWSEELQGKNTSQLCPYNARDTGYAAFWWTAMDKDGYLEDLEATGVTPDQLSWGTLDESQCVNSPNPTQPMQCSGSKNYGMLYLNPDFPVSNPKEIISARLPNITTFKDQSAMISTLADSNLYLGNMIAL